MQTIEDGDQEQSGNFFRAVALESYIQLNDSLRVFEEQRHRQVHYSFGMSGLQSGHRSQLRALLSSAGDQPQDALVESGGLQDQVGSDSEPAHSSLGGQKALPAHADVLEQFDPSAELLFRADEPKDVQAGTVKALVVHSTRPSSSLLFQEAFLYTFPGFVRSAELISLLQHRYLRQATAITRSGSTTWTR